MNANIKMNVKMKREKIVSRSLVLILLILVLIEFVPIIQHNSGRDYSYHADLKKTMEWISKNTKKDDVILTTWPLGPIVLGFAGRSVIATTKVYPSESRAVGERYADLSRFFYSGDENYSYAVAAKYNSTYVLINRNFNFRNQNSIAKMLVEKSNLSRFNLAYESGNFLVYKISKTAGVKKESESASSLRLDSGFSNYRKEISDLMAKIQSKKFAGAYGAIVPHDSPHSFAIIAREMNSINRNISDIFLLGPDHLSASKYDAYSSDADWNTPFGVLEHDDAMVKKLSLPIDNGVHYHEHSLRTIMPFIKSGFPDAKIIPILFRYDASLKESLQLGTKISDLMDEKALVLASIDFSHINPANREINRIEDEKSLSVISDFKTESVEGIIAEGKPAIITLLSAMKNINATKIVLLNMSSSAYESGSGTKSVGYISILFLREK